jgi:hypothetical protein
MYRMQLALAYVSPDMFTRKPSEAGGIRAFNARKIRIRVGFVEWLRNLIVG